MATEHISSSSNGALQPANDGETNVPVSKPLPANSERGVSEDVRFNLGEAEERPNRTDKAQDQQSGPNRGRGREGRGGRGGGKGRGQDQKRKDRGPENRRERNGDWREQKRRRVNEDGTPIAAGDSYMSIPFSEAEIAAESRRPKRKVAVMIGYSGTGYHGLQINHKDKTIEGDIFAALVAANAISKANADDPRKSSFVRCARTDKGVHAAGNMISLKLIIEDPDVVEKINAALPSQIRVWGIVRTNNAFSCYQACDSRWYEYLMPSYCLLPPHPESFLGKKVLESVRERGIDDEYAERLGEVKDYWRDVEENDIKPILESLEPDVRELVIQRMHTAEKDLAAQDEAARQQASGSAPDQEKLGENGKQEDATTKAPETAATEESTVAADLASAAPAEPESTDSTEVTGTKEERAAKLFPVEVSLKKIKAAYVAAKRRYRASPERIARLQQALNLYEGTRNYHNYTIHKAFGEASAKRLIKSFVVDPEPIQINDTQWLSLKVHGQSFMMHQIRKMVGLAVMATRCGAAAPEALIPETYGPARISIPRAPGLGLLLERPVFDSYNRRASDNLGLDTLDYAKYETEIRKFKDQFIYRHIFELEEKENSFHTFFHQIDNFKSDSFLWVTAGGIEAAKQKAGPAAELPEEIEGPGEEDEEDAAGGEG